MFRIQTVPPTLRRVSQALFGALFVVLAFGTPAFAQDYSSQPVTQPAPAPDPAPVFVAPVLNAPPSGTTYGFSDSLPATGVASTAATSAATATPQATKLAHTGGSYLLPISAALVLLGFGGLLLTGFRQAD